MRTEEFLTRICKLEKLTEAMMKDRATDGLAWEQDMLHADRRIEALEKRTWDSGINQGAHEGMIERIAKLENSIASLKLCVPPPEVESVRCDCNQTSFVGHAEKAQTRSDE